MKSENLNFLEPFGPLQARNGTALPTAVYLGILLRPVSFVFRYLIKMPAFLMLNLSSYKNIWKGLFRPERTASPLGKVTRYTEGYCMSGGVESKGNLVQRSEVIFRYMWHFTFTIYVLKKHDVVETGTAYVTK